MFWDKVAPAYDLFETVYNAKEWVQASRDSLIRNHTKHFLRIRDSQMLNMRLLTAGCHA